VASERGWLDAGMEPIDLVGDGLTLRIPRKSDLDDIVEACNDPEMIRWTTVPHPYGLDEAREFVFNLVAGGWAYGNRLVFAITRTDEDRFCGSIDLRIAPEIGAEIGYAVAPWARGHGVGTAAVRMVCRWAFETLELPRIEWQAEVGNAASRRLAERVGFVVEGTCRRRLEHCGTRVDGWIGSLLPDELR
jgi:RimJ/RimL family protein N-acetyltransferase